MKTYGDLPARYTIEHAGNPLALNRYLAVSNEGRLVWAHPHGRIRTFDSEQKAEDFRQSRMSNPDGAVVVRHTVQ